MPQHPPDHFSKLAQELIGTFRGVPVDEPRRQVKRPTQSAANVMEGIVTKFHLGESTAADSLRARWPELVTPTLAAYSHVVEISASGWLVVMVSNSVAKQELTNNRRIFLPRIKAVPGCGTIKGLTFRAG